MEVSSDLVRGFIFVIRKGRLSFLLFVPIYLRTFMGTIRIELRQSIVINVEWPDMKPVRLLCYMFLLAFWIWPCTRFNDIPIILNLLTKWIETSHLFIQSQFVKKKTNKQTKDCARSGIFQHKVQHRCFQLWCLPAFITSLLYYVHSKVICAAEDLPKDPCHTHPPGQGGPSLPRRRF